MTKIEYFFPKIFLKKGSHFTGMCTIFPTKVTTGEGQISCCFLSPIPRTLNTRWCYYPVFISRQFTKCTSLSGSYTTLTVIEFAQLLLFIEFYFIFGYYTVTKAMTNYSVLSAPQHAQRDNRLNFFHQLMHYYSKFRFYLHMNMLHLNISKGYQYFSHYWTLTYLSVPFKPNIDDIQY